MGRGLTNTNEKKSYNSNLLKIDMYRIRELEYGQQKHKKHETRLKKMLRLKKIKQNELAEGTGIAKSTISEIVSGQQVDMLMRTAKNIAYFLECTIDELFGEGVLTERQTILKEIDKWISSLDDEDVNSYVYLGKFRDLVDSVEVNSKNKLGL
jgi:transcriptional regulator with XRE-family HTH domain